jgi:hypothetical protein
MEDEIHSLEFPATDQEAVVLCLALGTLEAIRGGNWPLEAGIWSLGRPAFWRPLAELYPQTAIILQEADELSALAKLASHATAETAINDMILAIRARLSALPEKCWNARWSGEESM